MVVRGFTTSLAIVAAALVLAGGAPATPPVPGEAQAFAAVKHSRLGPTDKAAYRGEIARAVHLARTLPGGRWQHVVNALEQFSPFEKKLTKQRALILFGQLKANDDYFAHHYAPKDKYDFVGADGVVYRYFAGRSFEFHPLANFGRLNALVAANDGSGAQQLADALIARVSTSTVAASASSTSSRSAAAVRRGSRAWRRRSPHRPSPAQRRSCRMRRPPTCARRTPPIPSCRACS